MQDEQHSSRPETAGPASQTDKEWSELQRDLDTLGQQLAGLGSHSAALGETVLANLQSHFQEVKTRALTYKQAADQQIEQVRQTAFQQAREAGSTYDEARTISTEAARDAARQVWERSEPLRQGAKDVGEGLARAWTELRASFGKAAGRLNSESSSSTANGPATPASSETRETT